MKQNESQVRVQFHGMAAGGDAVGRDESGRIVFAPSAAPGDIGIVRLPSSARLENDTSPPSTAPDANLEHQEIANAEDANAEDANAEDANAEIANAKRTDSPRHRSHARGRLIRLETQSPQRVTPPCPFYDSQIEVHDDMNARDDIGGASAAESHEKTYAVNAIFAAAPSAAAPSAAMSNANAPALTEQRRAELVEPRCGGCQWQHLAYAAQLEAKTAMVREALRRIGGMGEAVQSVVEPCVASPAPFFYRNKAEFVVAPSSDAYAPLAQEQGNEQPSAEQSPKASRPGMSTHVGTGKERGVARIGFYARESHHVVDVSRCLIQQETNNAVLHAAREALALGLVEPFDARSGRGVLRRLVARTSSSGDVLVIVETTSAAWPQEADFVHHMRSRVASLVGLLRRESQHLALQHFALQLPARHSQRRHREEPRSQSRYMESRYMESRGGERVKWGPSRLIGAAGGRDWIEENVGGLRLRATGDSFFQVNTSLTSGLVETALELAQVESETFAIDVFCGVGLFALVLARAGATVVGIEEHPGAVRDARANATSNGLCATFLQGDAARELRRLAQSRLAPTRSNSRRGTANSRNAQHLREAKSDDAARQPLDDSSTAQAASAQAASAQATALVSSRRLDVLLLDPPRAGAAACIDAIARLRPLRIVYVSCDAATLARDVKTLAAHGYRVDRAVPFDLFPQTAHVETVVRLISS